MHGQRSVPPDLGWLLKNRELFIGTLHFNNGPAIISAMRRNGDLGVPGARRVIIDDGSTEENYSRFEREFVELGLPGEVLRHRDNRGVCARLNEWLWREESPYLAWVCDDWMEPWHLPEAVSALEAAGSQVAAYFCKTRVVRADGELIEVNDPLPAFVRAGLPESSITPDRPILIPGSIALDAMMQGNVMPAPSAVLRRAAVQSVGGWNESLCVEDYDMWLRLAQRFDFLYSNRAGANYVIHGQNQTTRNAWRIALDAYRTLALHSAAPSDVRQRLRGLRSAAHQMSRAIRFMPREGRRKAAMTIARAVAASVPDLALSLVGRVRAPDRQGARRT